MKHRLKKNRRSSRVVFRFHYPLLGVLLLPLLASLVLSIGSLLRGFPGEWSSVWPVAAGAAAYALFQWAFQKPMGVYVFGHELSHSLAAWLSGYRVKSFTASPNGGQVVLSDTNLFVALAPYCFPLYTILVVAVFLLIRWHSRLSAPPLWCAFAIGFTFAFHLALTWHALRQNQPDLRHGGTFLSLLLILFANGFVFVLLLKTLFPHWISFKAFLAQWTLNTVLLAEKMWEMASWAMRRGKGEV